ncbi:MAG: hypothetical protein RIR66_163 [Actinomycetota bacterium]|jgi:hypothetical protein
MQFIQFLRRDLGSNTVGFALVSPLLVGAFLSVSQIANLVNVQTVMHAAVKSGAREAGRYDATLNDGVQETKAILASHGITEITQISALHRLISGKQIVEIAITKKYQIPWLNYSLELTATGQAIDEKNF